MKKFLLFALGAAFSSSPAWAQSQITGQLPPLESLPLEKLPLELQLQFDPKLPEYPKLEVSQPARVQIRVLPTYRGPLFQLEVVRKSVGDVLESVTAALGARSVTEPVLKRRFYQTAVIRALSLEELLAQVGGSEVERWKSSAGVYFFADKPNPAVQKMLDDLTKLRQPDRTNSGVDPFIVPMTPLKQPKPQPDWGIIPFNGRDVFIVPLPTAPQAPTPNKP